MLNITLDKLVSILKPLTNKELDYNKENISTVLINSNFSCGFYIDRFKLYKILKHKYGISAAYDPCSYPGIQSKFYYHPEKLEQNGVKNNTYKEGWTQISFMVFRTGSVLIVGNCDKNILNKIYIFLKDILREEYSEICLKNNTTKKKMAVKKVRKKPYYFLLNNQFVNFKGDIFFKLLFEKSLYNFSYIRFSVIDIF